MIELDPAMIFASIGIGAMALCLLGCMVLALLVLIGPKLPTTHRVLLLQGGRWESIEGFTKSGAEAYAEDLRRAGVSAYVEEATGHE